MASWCSGLALWLFAGCATVSATKPDAHDVQRAYDPARIESGAAPLHLYELIISAAKCDALRSGDGYVCQINFVRRDEPSGRLYFDVITIAHCGDHWELLSGHLCKGRQQAR